MRLPPLLCALLLAGCAAPPDAPRDGGDGAERALRCVEPCPVTIDATQRWWEPTLAVDPKDSRHVVVGSTINAIDPTTGEHALWNVALVTRDAGATWTSTRLPGGPSAGPGHPLATATGMGDPGVAFLPDGTILYSGSAQTMEESPPHGVAVRRGYELFVALSTDGGATFPTASIVAKGAGAAVEAAPIGLGLPPFAAGWRANDKASLTVGPDGTTLLAWTDLSQLSDKDPTFYSCAIVFSTSKDGVTWSAPATVEEGCFNGASPAITRDGNVWAIAYYSSAAPGDARGCGDLRVARSLDEGATWSAASVGRASFMPTLRAFGAYGLALAYPATVGKDDCAHQPAEAPSVVASRDGGKTWGAPLALDDPPGPARTLPTLDVADDGTAYVAYFHVAASGTGDAARRDFRVAKVQDGRLVAATTLDPGIVGPAASLGDYVGIAHAAGGAYAVWVTRHAQTYDLVGGFVQDAPP